MTLRRLIPSLLAMVVALQAHDAAAQYMQPSVGVPQQQQPMDMDRQERQRGQRQTTPVGNDKSAPALMTADQIVHDRDLNTVTARGHVEIDHNGRILIADTLSYNLKQDVIVVTGNVSMTEASGEVTFADYMEVTGDMRRAAAQGIRVLLIDNSRMAGATGTRIAGEKSVLNKGIYTPCEPCAKDPSSPPLWDIKAEKITHNEQRHVIEYEDAWLEVGGYPTVYTPYFEHADPTVSRKSGLLGPTFVNSKVLGFGVRTPYFQVIDPFQDITLAPLMTTEKGDQLAATHRWRNEIGEAKTTASVSTLPGAGDQTNSFGWHINSKATFDLDSDWRAGWQIERASDRDYLRTYGYRTTDPYLTTRPYVEGFGYRSYSSLEAYSFQNLSTYTSLSQTANTLSKQPVVLPLGTYSFVSEPSKYGDYWTFDTHAASVNRSEGTNSRRVNTLTSWHLPLTTSNGQLITLTTSLHADAYNSDHLTIDQPGQVNAARVMPDTSAEWRYPFTKVTEHASQTITPIVVASATPYGGNSSKIPNEDSLDFELDDINIFSPTPFTGYDRILTGPRVAYGAQYDYVNRGLMSGDFVLGQLYQAHPANIFQQGTGLDGHFSDIVGRTDISPSTNFNLGYRYRLSREDGSIRRSEVSSTIGPTPLRLSVSYLFFAKASPTSPFEQRDQISGVFYSQLSRYWSTQFFTTQDIGPGAQNLQTGGRVSYEDECLIVATEAGQLNTTLRGILAGRYMVVRFTFKTLTALPVSIF